MVHHEELFLDHKDITNLMKWEYKVIDNSWTTEKLTPFWNWILAQVPLSVAPNQLTTCSLVCMMLGTMTCALMMETYPILSCFLVSTMIFSSQTLDAIDGKQARRTKNGSFIGELFDHGCDSVGAIGLCYMLIHLFNIQGEVNQWCLIQGGQLLFMDEHLQTLISKDQTVTFGKWSGPGEVLCGVEALFILKGIFLAIFGTGLPFNISFLMPFAYGTIFVLALTRIIDLPTQFTETRRSLLLCLGMRGLATMYTTLLASRLEEMDLICSGLVITIITGDLILAKMARRQLHPIVPSFVLFSLLQTFHWGFAIPPFVVYYGGVFYDLCKSTGLPMMTLVKNVYVDGAYDCFHYGHMKIISTALNYGNRIIIGVVKDLDVADYKRQPVMTQSERRKSVETHVQACKYIYEIVDCPYPAMDLDFIKKHNIHVVVCSEEYDPAQHGTKPGFVDYYKAPRDHGVEIYYLPRTDGISTSEIIQTIKKRSDL
jgi:cytidyltransferase-like protein